MTAEAKLLSEEQIAVLNEQARSRDPAFLPSAHSLVEIEQQLLSHIATLTAQLAAAHALIARMSPKALFALKDGAPLPAGQGWFEADHPGQRVHVHEVYSPGAAENLLRLEAMVRTLEGQRNEVTAELAAVKSTADAEAIAAESYRIIWPDGSWANASDVVKAKWTKAVSHIAAHYRQQVAELEAENTRLEQELACRCETCGAHKSLPCNHCKAPEWHCQMCCELAQLRQRAEGAERKAEIADAQLKATIADLGAVCDDFAKQRDDAKAELAAAHQRIKDCEQDAIDQRNEYKNFVRKALKRRDAELAATKEQLAACEGELERVRRTLPNWIKDFSDTLSELTVLRPGSYRASARLNEMMAFLPVASPPAPATQPDSPPAFRCPRCKGTIATERDDGTIECATGDCGWTDGAAEAKQPAFQCPKCGCNRLWDEHLEDGQLRCAVRKCSWVGTWSEVAAAKGGEVANNNHAENEP